MEKRLTSASDKISVWENSDSTIIDHGGNFFVARRVVGFLMRIGSLIARIGAELTFFGE